MAEQNAKITDEQLKEVRESQGKVNQILKTHEPLPLGDVVEKELEKICKRAAAV